MMKNLILNLPFVQDAIKHAFRTGKASALTDKAVLSKEQVDEAVSALLGTVDERKIIKVDSEKGFVYLNDKMLEQVQVQNFRAEAEIIEQLDLWKIMTTTIEASAQKRIFVDSKDVVDILAGKMALYNLSLMKKILTVFLAKKV